MSKFDDLKSAIQNFEKSSRSVSDYQQLFLTVYQTTQQGSGLMWPDVTKAIECAIPALKKVYVANNTLWVAYAPFSGITMPFFNSKSYITPEIDSIANDLITYSNTALPNLVKKGSKLFKIPIYKNDVDVFKNNPKPDSFTYMIVNKSIINFHKTKKEAIIFM